MQKSFLKGNKQSLLLFFVFIFQGEFRKKNLHQVTNFVEYFTEKQIKLVSYYHHMFIFYYFLLKLFCCSITILLIFPPLLFSAQPTLPTVSPHPIVHVHGSLIHVPWLVPSPSLHPYPPPLSPLCKFKIVIALLTSQSFLTEKSLFWC